MIQPLTKRQREVFDFIAAQLGANGYAPSLEEIGRHFGLTSLATVHKHVTILSEKGWLTRRWGHSRAIAVTAACCPMCGKLSPTSEANA